jgi:hypothetical protein
MAQQLNHGLSSMNKKIPTSTAVPGSFIQERDQQLKKAVKGVEKPDSADGGSRSLVKTARADAGVLEENKAYWRGF